MKWLFLLIVLAFALGGKLSVAQADGPASTYLDYMRYNVTLIVEALGAGDE